MMSDLLGQLVTSLLPSSTCYKMIFNNWEQVVQMNPDISLMTDLLQPACRSGTTCAFLGVNTSRKCFCFLSFPPLSDHKNLIS